MVAIFLFSPLPYLSAQQISKSKELLKQAFDLIPIHSKDTQFYEMESTLQKHALDGTVKGSDVYRMYLRCVPSDDFSRGDEYTCLRFTVQANDYSEVSVPSLANWKYNFSLTADADNRKGQVFGIDHSRFEKLTDENGRSLPIESPYHLYNAFIDFHSMSVFAEKAANDSGVQDLKYIGEKIVHAAAFSQPPVNLGTQVAEGSYFKNGKITLGFKGLGWVNEKTCAILEYDSGKSSFFMLMKPMANMDVPTKGSSHYWGDIYKDLTGGWIQKAVLHELVISETSMPVLNSKINAFVERSIIIKNVKKINF